MKMDGWDGMRKLSRAAISFGQWLHTKIPDEGFEEPGNWLELKSGHEALMARLCWMKALEENKFYSWQYRMLQTRDNLEALKGEAWTKRFFTNLMERYPKELYGRQQQNTEDEKGKSKSTRRRSSWEEDKAFEV